MDNLIYTKNGSRLVNNKLVRVTAAAAGNYTEDLNTHPEAINYEYNDICNLIKYYESVFT